VNEVDQGHHGEVEASALEPDEEAREEPDTTGGG